jgi:hypothetical protein
MTHPVLGDRPGPGNGPDLRERCAVTDNEAATDRVQRAISHTECVYAPGDAGAARALFELLGFSVRQREGSPFMIANIDPGETSLVHNCVYASEVTTAQANFEYALGVQLSGSAELRDAAQRWQVAVRAHPDMAFHIGFRCNGRSDFDDTVERIRVAGGPGGELQDRVSVRSTAYPGDLGSITTTMAQAFIWTDVVGLGIRNFGQVLELQWHVEEAG